MLTPVSLRRATFGLAAALLALAGCQPRLAPASASACIDPAKVKPDAMCTMEYAPVCGCDGKTYPNACAADRAGVRTYQPGTCAGR